MPGMLLQMHPWLFLLHLPVPEPALKQVYMPSVCIFRRDKSMHLYCPVKPGLYNMCHQETSYIRLDAARLSLVTKIKIRFFVTGCKIEASNEMTND
mgnify:CR=1 FL=1